MPGPYAAMLFLLHPPRQKLCGGGGGADGLGVGRGLAQGAVQQDAAFDVTVYQDRRGAQQVPAAQRVPLRGGRRGRVELAPGQQRLDLGGERYAEQLALARSGGGDDTLLVTDGHGAAQPPGQHVRIDGGRLAELGQRRILLNMTSPLPSV